MSADPGGSWSERLEGGCSEGSCGEVECQVGGGAAKGEEGEMIWSKQLQSCTVLHSEEEWV